jgi:hypothetical protein
MRENDRRDGLFPPNLAFPEVAEKRRTAALRDFENLQAKFASRLRKASDAAIIDGEYTETDPAPAETGNRPPIKAQRPGTA